MNPLDNTTLPCAAVLAAGLAFSIPGISASAQSDPTREMVEALWAPGPHSSLGDKARLFDRFVGSWDCEYSLFADDGAVTRFSGELLFGWILDGRALQDIWISYPRPGAGAERNIGTSVRIFDEKSGEWRVVWVAASFGSMITLHGGAEGDRIVLRGTDTDGSELRWSFNDIRPDSFVWRGELSRDGGQSWRLQEEHRMRRRGTTLP